MTTIMQILPIKTRVKFRKDLQKILVMRKKQLENANKLFLPLTDNIKFIESTLKNNIHMENYIKHSLKVNKYLKKVGMRKNNV